MEQVQNRVNIKEEERSKQNNSLDAEASRYRLTPSAANSNAPWGGFFFSQPYYQNHLISVGKKRAGRHY